MGALIIIFIVVVLLGIKNAQSSNNHDSSEQNEIHHHYHKPTYTINGKAIDSDPAIEKIFDNLFNKNFK